MMGDQHLQDWLAFRKDYVTIQDVAAPKKLITNYNDKFCKFSQLQKSGKHEHDYGHDDTLQPTQNLLALCHRVILDSVEHWWVPARTPMVHQCLYGGRPWVARSKLHSPTTDKRQQDQDKP